MTRSLGVCFLACAAMLVTPTLACAQGSPDVRQIVTFLFQPGRLDSALAIYERELIPAYRANASMLRYRGYREAESPEPLDLIVISNYAGMAGMDASNDALRPLSSGGRSVFQWYGVLAAMSQHHHDQFVEMLPALGDPESAAADSLGGLTVLEYVRVAPGERRAYESLVADGVRATERRLAGVRWSETGRLLISDGWDYLRVIAVASLGDWHDHRQAMQRARFGEEIERLVTARKTIVVRQLPRLSVR